MGNLRNYNFNKLDAFLSNSDYTDYYLANDGLASPCCLENDSFISDCTTLHYDFNNQDIYQPGTTSGGTIFSLETWEDAVNEGYSLPTFGLTGIDNGYIKYVDDSTFNNQSLVETITGTTIEIPSGDTRFFMNKVSGNTDQYIYPIDIIEDETILGDYNSFCGGFYQGYYKLDGNTYQTQPNRHEKAWVAEFWVNKTELNCTGHTGQILNDTYPDNKGFFFYMGTRSENKYWNFFEGINTGCTSGCTSDSGCTEDVTSYCTVPKETEVYIDSDEGYPISLSPRYFDIQEITNPFLIYGRASKLSGHTNGCGVEPSGLGNETVCSYSGDSITITSTTRPIVYETNPFLIYGRASKLSGDTNGCGVEPSGFGNETVCSYSAESSNENINLDNTLDVIDNAIGFRIKDDGSIGYRLLTSGCTSGDTSMSAITIEEGYSLSGEVRNDVWEHIVIRYVMDEYYDDCKLKYGKPRNGRLMFYINGKLKFAVDNISELVFKRLNDFKEKQLGVPFNFSLGGGSQGLLESMTFDGQDKEDLGLLIEDNFAGTFIGGISQFKFYNCDLNWCEITKLYNDNILRYSTINGIFSYQFD